MGGGAAAEVMNAGYVVEKMETKEQFAYISGIVEGMAYARFRKDTIAAGSKDERGSNCIYDWYHTDSRKTHASIFATFRNNPEQLPTVIIALMIKRECGE